MARETKAQQQYRLLVLEHTKAMVEGGALAYDEAGDYFYRPDELLVVSSLVPDLEQALSELGAGDIEHDEELPVARVRLPAGSDVPAAVQELRKQAGGVGPEAIGPHHALFGVPRWHSCPGRPPSPGDPVDLSAGGSDGEGVLIAVLDTGQSQDSLSGAWESAHVRAGAELDLLDGDGDGNRDLVAGHGTFITGIIAQVAPGAEVLVLAPLTAHGLTDDLTAARAVVTARKAGAAILNLSFGGYAESDAPPLALAAALADVDGKDPKGDGPVVVAAAGNDGVSRRFFPAALPGVIAVAALNASGRRAGFSNYGPWVDACADGDRLLSTFIEGEVATDSDADGQRDQFGEPFAYWSGTSFAAPQVAAAIAVRMSQAGESARAAAAALVRDPAVVRRPGIGAHVPTSLSSNPAAPGRP